MPNPKFKIEDIEMHLKEPNINQFLLQVSSHITDYKPNLDHLLSYLLYKYKDIRQLYAKLKILFMACNKQKKEDKKIKNGNTKDFYEKADNDKVCKSNKFYKAGSNILHEKILYGILDLKEFGVNFYLFDDLIKLLECDSAFYKKVCYWFIKGVEIELKRSDRIVEYLVDWIDDLLGLEEVNENDDKDKDSKDNENVNDENVQENKFENKEVDLRDSKDELVALKEENQVDVEQNNNSEQKELKNKTVETNSNENKEIIGAEVLVEDDSKIKKAKIIINESKNNEIEKNDFTCDMSYKLECNNKIKEKEQNEDYNGNFDVKELKCIENEDPVVLNRLDERSKNAINVAKQSEKDHKIYIERTIPKLSKIIEILINNNGTKKYKLFNKITLIAKNVGNNELAKKYFDKLKVKNIEKFISLYFEKLQFNPILFNYHRKVILLCNQKNFSFDWAMFLNSIARNRKIEVSDMNYEVVSAEFLFESMVGARKIKRYKKLFLKVVRGCEDVELMKKWMEKFGEKSSYEWFVLTFKNKIIELEKQKK